jgi:branched-chain amino acid transport system permease protein/neutral amino acid transport system permease protein
VSVFVSSIGFGIVTAAILAVGAVGFTMQFSVTNILNVGYGDIMTASAYVAYFFNHGGLGIWYAMLVAGLFGGVLSVLLNRFLFVPFIRRGTKLFGMVIVTLSIGLIIQNAVLAIWGPDLLSYRMSVGRSFHLSSMVFTTSQFGIIGIAIAAMATVLVLLTYTKLGKAMRAISSNVTLARSCGIPTERVSDLAWLISGALCGIAGVILVINTTSFGSTTGADFLVIIIAAAMLGGVGHPYGAMVGALTLGLLTEVSAAVFAPVYKEVIALAVLVVVLLFRPQGILAAVATRREVAA